MLQFLKTTSALGLVMAGVAMAPAQIDPSLFSGLQWRNIGPFRGGRVAAVSGAIGQPGTFYMGMPLGGVWKTTGAGSTWVPIMDSVKEASSVGAIEVAPSDPNVIYVGMGDLITGGGINEGNGVYKSTDAGKTWTHLGLDETKQIPSILVDPHNPNLVLVAAQGNIRTKNEDRGVFRSTDGGKTWTRTLFLDDQTGIQKITWAYDNPKVMLATTVRHYNPPSRPGATAASSTSAGTKLFKSTDEGITWTEVKGTGLPTLSGRTSVAIAMGTNSQRMFIVGNFGLYRSDDGGTTWRKMGGEDRRVANGQGGYNCGVYVNPKNPDIVYVVNTCSYRSLDGGNTFTGFKGAPGGDDPQQFWFDPTDGNRILLGSDQGATVSQDGGQSWSSWYNQPTAQVYHISTDNAFPYRVYATQQDSGSIGTSTRGNLGAITPLDWIPHPGYEFGSIVADPRNPNITYAGGPSGGIIKTTYPSGQWINVSPNLDSGAGLRKVGNQLMAFSPTNPRELMVGFQYLMSTTDGGMTWKKLSPDLGYPKGYKPPAPAAPEAKKPDSKKPTTAPPVKPTGTVELDEEEDISYMVFGDDEEQEMERQQAAAPGGSIESFSPSSIDGGIIWVGTTNGLIKLTKDHGQTWEDVSIKYLPNRIGADISAIDASHTDPGTAYVAIDYHRSGDLTPWFYRTNDYGQHWTKIVNGLPTDLPSGSYARVIRADTKRKGLVFAGTESFVYVSFDDGDHWQSLAQNLPNTSYRDMVVHGNDLVVGTYGRSFWVLDDISPLREIAVGMGNALFKPGDAIRVRRNVNGDTPFPPEVPHALNPPAAILYYHLAAEPKTPVTIEVRDSRGRPVKHFTSVPPAPYNDPLPPVPDFWLEQPKPLSTSVGTNRVGWDLQYDAPPASSHGYGINANPGETPRGPEGPLVEPGEYTVTLTVDGKSYSQKIKVVNDPRSPARASAVHAQSEMLRNLYYGIQTAWDRNNEVVEMRKSVAEMLKGTLSADLKQKVEDFDAKLLSMTGPGGGGRRFGPQTGPPPKPSFMGVHGSMLRLMGELDSGDMAPNEPARVIHESAISALAAVSKTWKELCTKDLPALNAALEKAGIKPIGHPG